MKRLILLRHAKSEWKKNISDDYRRGLNNRGKKDIKIMAKVIKESNFNLDLIISSPAKRTKKQLSL